MESEQGLIRQPMSSYAIRSSRPAYKGSVVEHGATIGLCIGRWRCQNLECEEAIMCEHLRDASRQNMGYGFILKD